MRNNRLSVLSGLLTFVVVSALYADAVYTVDGSKLVGRIEQMYKGKLTINTEVAGKLTIETSQIVAIEASEALTVEFESGDRLVGTIAVSSDQESATMHTALGELPVNSKQMVSAWPEGSESPVLTEVRSEAEKVTGQNRFFCGVFDLPSPRNAQKCDYKNREKIGLGFFVVFFAKSFRRF